MKIINSSFWNRFYSSVLLKSEMAKIINSLATGAENLAIEALKNGAVIAIPTDTVYGLGCSATNMSAIERLYKIKCRNENKPVAICLGEQSEIKNWAFVNHLPNGLLQSLLPGPVTLVLNASNKLDKSIVVNNKIGIRVPDHNFIRYVANGLTCPIALTSANVSSEPSTLDINEFKTLWLNLDYIFDEGILGTSDSNRRASTVIDLSDRNYFRILRDGMAYEKTVKILSEFGLNCCD